MVVGKRTNHVGSSAFTPYSRASAASKRSSHNHSEQEASSTLSSSLHSNIDDEEQYHNSEDISWKKHIRRRCQDICSRTKIWSPSSSLISWSSLRQLTQKKNLSTSSEHQRRRKVGLVAFSLALLCCFFQWNLPLVGVVWPSNNNNNNRTSSFLIICLTMNRLHSLQRLVRSLQASDYGHDGQYKRIHLQFHIDRPAGDDGKSKNPNDDNDETIRAWQRTVDWARNFSAQPTDIWPHGTVTVKVAPQNKGLRQAWLDAWHPNDDDDDDKNDDFALNRLYSLPTQRAIILEDDVEVSPLWYKWVQHMYQRYGNQPDIAGFSLQRQKLVPTHNKPPRPQVRHINADPFLYNLVGSIGFVPMPRHWRNFVEWTRCALCNGTEQSVATSELVTSGWYYKNKASQRNMWTQPFIYFMKHYNLYCLYQFPKRGNLALARHWREPGTHFSKQQGTAKADFELATQTEQLKWYNLPVEEAREWIGSYGTRNLLSNINNQNTHHQLVRYDWGMQRRAPPSWQQRPFRTVVITCAVGYKNLGDYRRFVGSLRRHYPGEIKMMIGYQTSWRIQRFLRRHGVQVQKASEGRSWEDFNRFRFDFINNSCRKGGPYDWCLSIDFRDAKFQANPFDWEPLWNPIVGSHEEEHILYPVKEETASINDTNAHPPPNLILFAHIWTWVSEGRPSPIRWHWNHLQDCGALEQFKGDVVDKPIVNAGGFYATPDSMTAIRNLVLEHPQLKVCNDQVTLNVGLHAGLLRNNSSVRAVLWDQGYGSINNVGYMSLFARDSLGRFAGKDCFLSRVVHQFNKKLKPPLNAQCLDEYSNQTTTGPSPDHLAK